MGKLQEEIIKKYKSGRSKLGIAKDLKVSRSYIYEYLIQHGLYKTKGFQHIKRKLAK